MWRKHYETYLDNLIKQTLNELKLHEAIRGEYIKLESYLNSLSSKATNSFCPSNSWTFDSKKIIQKTNSNENDDNEKMFNSLEQTNGCQTLARLNELLSQQQLRQLGLIDELSHLAFSLKINTDNKTFISDAELNLVNGCRRDGGGNIFNDPNLNSNKTQLISVLNHSENSLNSSKTMSKNKGKIFLNYF